MALIRPSLTLVFDLDERCASEEVRLELNRSYAHVAAPLIRTHAEESTELPAKNRARLIVNFGTSKYLDANDPQQEENWSNIVFPWIGNLLHKIGNNMKVFNDRQRKIHNEELYFDTLDWELEGSTLVIALHPSGSGLVSESVKEFFNTVRSLKSSKTMGEIVRVEIPASESYDNQRCAAWETWAQEHPEYFAAMQDAQEIIKDEVPKSREELLEEDIIAKSYENTAVAPTDSKTLPKPVRPEEEELEGFDFDVDYRLWEITTANGASVIYDNTQGNLN